jgi:hypothetical protein
MNQFRAVLAAARDVGCAFRGSFSPSTSIFRNATAMFSRRHCGRDVTWRCNRDDPDASNQKRSVGHLADRIFKPGIAIELSVYQVLICGRCFGQGAAQQETPVPRKQGETMRSDLIFGALTHVNNRYKLCQLASKATRKLHKPNTRLQDTTNEVLDRFKDTIPMDVASETIGETLVTERRAA